MSFLRETSIIFFADEKYDDIYQSLNSLSGSKKMEYKHLFLLATTVGFKNSKRIPINKRGRQWRATYMTMAEESLLINMLLSEPEINHKLEWLLDSDNEGKIKVIIEEYANGGMDLICKNGLEDYWDGEELIKKDSTIIFELSKYVLSQINDVPF